MPSYVCATSVQQGPLDADHCRRSFGPQYLLEADSSNPSDVYIFNVDASSWSTQSTSNNPSFDKAGVILDHDTNTFFALAGTTMSQLDLSAVTNAAGSSSLAWEGVGDSAIQDSSYIPTMAL